MDKISAYMDGEAASTEAQQTLNRLRQDEACREVWNRFHLVGDVMRGEPLLGDDFMTRLHQRIDDEPTVLAPRLTIRTASKFAFSAAAAIAGVAVILTVATTDNALRQPSNVTVVSPRGNDMIAQYSPATSTNVAQFNEYLMAHQEYSPRTALQSVLPYVRSVSATHDGDRR